MELHGGIPTMFKGQKWPTAHIGPQATEFLPLKISGTKCRGTLDEESVPAAEFLSGRRLYTPED